MRRRKKKEKKEGNNEWESKGWDEGNVDERKKRKVDLMIDVM